MASSNLYCQDSERALVGCIVSGEGEAFDACPATVEHFFDGPARTIFAAAHELHGVGSPIALGTVLHHLGQKAIADIGGTHVFSEICNHPSPDHALHYFGIVDAKLTLRRALRFGRWVQSEAESTDDPAEFSAELRRRAAEIEMQAQDESLLSASISALEDKIGAMERREYKKGVQTALTAWNELFGGMVDGQMYGIASRPGMGKTAAMEIMMLDYLFSGNPVCCFERDMSPQKLIERMACRVAGVPFWAFARGLCSPAQLETLKLHAKNMRDMPLHIHNPASLTPERLCAIARKDIRVHGCRAVFLDHIQTFGSGKDLREKLTSASIVIRENVTTTGVSHFILAHINRHGAKGRPSPEDIKEFDQLYGDADGMLLMWAEKDKAELEAGEKLEVHFYAAKNRDGAVSEATMLFDGAHMNFLPAPTK